MKDSRNNEEIEIDGIRYFNLRIRGLQISPCVVSYVYGQKNEMFWNNHALRQVNAYWFDVSNLLMKIGDRLEIISTNRKTNEMMKVVTLEVVELRKKSIRLLEIARSDCRKQASEEPRALDKCPTCHRSF